MTATVTLTAAPKVMETATLKVASSLKDDSRMISEADGMELVYVPAGEFWMGSFDGDKNAEVNERPAHEVYLDAYWIDRNEVTNGMYETCVHMGVCRAPRGDGSETRNAYYGEVQYANYPVIYVDWYMAKTYCEWAGRRLPSEAEWEKAARGTDGRIYPWGDEPPSCRLANHSSCEADTVAVGNYKAGISPYGALDMAGNVWEWVADWYDKGYYRNSPRENPSGASFGEERVVRGGGWNSVVRYVRSANRYWRLPSHNLNNLGFRCALSTSP